MAIPIASSAPAAPRAPADLGWWLHVERPSTIVPLVQGVVGSAIQAMSLFAPSSGPGLVGWVDALAAEEPVDFMMTARARGESAYAVRFAIAGQDAFRQTIDKQGYEATEESGDRLVVRPAGGGKGEPTAVCDMSTSPVVVCGNEEGVEQLAAWLRTMPKPAGARDDEARLEVTHRTLARWLPAGLAGDASGGVVTLRAGPTDFALDVQLSFASVDSPWTHALLAPGDVSPPPAEMGRIPDRADVAVVSEGRGPVVALLEKLLDDPVRSTLAPLLPLVEKPWAIGFGLDVAEARAAATALRGGVTDPKKLADAVTGGLETHSWFASSVDVATVQATLRAAVKAAPSVLTSAKLQIRTPAPAARLPRGSFVLDVTRATQKTFFVFVPDGALTWGMSGSDEARVARFASRVLATPAATRPDLRVDGATVVSASLWDQAGAPWRSVDPLPSTPAGRAEAAQAIESALAAPPSALRLAFVQESTGTAGGKAATLRVSGSAAAAGKLAANVAGSLFSIVFLLSMLASGVP